jgi:hypothetical protein
MAATANASTGAGLAGTLKARLAARWAARARTYQVTHEFSHLLRETAHLFVTHPVPLLSVSLLGLAGAALISNLLYTVLILEVYHRIGSYFSSSMNIFYTQMIVQAVLGFVLMSFSRGAITWMALHASHDKANDPTTSITAKNAVRAALRNWKPLLLSSIIYGLLMSLAVAGITYTLREMRLDLSNYRWLRSEAGAITGAMTIRGIAVSVPDPGSPFTELYGYIRYSLSRSTSSVYYGWLSVRQTIGKASIPIALVLLGSGTLVLLIDTLLCFRHAEIMKQNNAGLISWFAHSGRLARAHFWRVATVRLGLRLMTYLFTLFCLTLPMTVQQGLLLPAVVSRMQNYLPYALNGAITGIVLAMANAVFIAFALVFDARLNVRLSNSTDGERISG